MIYNLKNELGKTYLIAGIDFEIKDDYRLKMITENVIDGLIPINIRQIDGEKRAYYDVTDKKSLSRFLAHNDPDYNEIRLLIGSILKVSKVGCEYLLEESCISFEPDTIYKNNLTGDYEFLYLPKKISGDVTFDFEDPSLTGKLFGAICMFYPLLSETMRVTPDFTKQILEGDLHIKGHIRVIHVVTAAVKLLLCKAIWRTYKDVRNFSFSSR